LPVIDAGLSLQKNEQCYYTSAAKWMENRTVTKAVKYSVSSTTFKYYSGTHRTYGTRTTERITADVIKTIDTGTVYITNKRLIFIGVKKNSTILLKKVLSITPYTDAVEFEKDSGKSPYICVGDDNGDIFRLIVLRILSDLQKENE
jgi:hypothetical protein